MRPSSHSPLDLPDQPTQAMKSHRRPVGGSR
jgi:hypothetical protein